MKRYVVQRFIKTGKNKQITTRWEHDTAKDAAATIATMKTLNKNDKASYEVVVEERE